MSYTKKRYFFYAFITFFILLVPFITIDGNHILLLSFEKFEFHFLGFVFSVSELYVMPFLLIALFVSVFVTTSILGKFWCGWMCPQTIFRVIYRDLIEGTLLDLRKIKNKQKDIDYSKTKNLLRVYFAVFLWSILSLVIASNFIWYFVPPEDFFNYLKNSGEHMFMISFLIFLAIFFTYNIVFLKEKFCVYVCPYSRTQNVLYDDYTKHVIYDVVRGEDECTACEACVRVCPTHIDIRDGLQLDCINCLECSDACSSVMGKLGKESLISWESKNSMVNKVKTSIFSKRNTSYFFVIIVSLLLAVVSITKKETLLVNINKTNQNYRIDKNANVSNGYVIAIHNIQDRAYTYDIKIEDNKIFEIQRFKALSIEAKKRVKEILIIQTKEKLNLSDRKDSILKLKIRIFAREDPKIYTIQDVAFIYPRNDLLR